MTDYQQLEFIMMIVQGTHWKSVPVVLAVMAIFVPPALAVGVPEPIADGDSIWGDWQLTQVDKDGHTFSPILSFSEDPAGKLTGHWISLGSDDDLADLEYSNYRLSFKRIERLSDFYRISSFTGSADRESLEGMLTEEQRGVSKVQGKWIRPMPEAAGTWEGKITVNDQVYPASLIIRADKDGKLAAEWKSQWGEHSITDVTFKDDKLTFKRKSNVQDRQWESSFEGTIKGDALSGKFKSELGENAFQAQRLGAGLIGKWHFQIQSEAGSYSQILTVNPDLSGLCGVSPVEQIILEGDTIRFNTKFVVGGKLLFEDHFSGKMEETRLRGQIVNSFGKIAKLEGVKLPTPPRKKPSTQSRPLRQPDVPYVGTPQHVVDKMLELAAVTKDDIVYDLGCGDGRIVITAAQKFGCRGVGYDISPDRVKESRANAEKYKVAHLVTIEQRDIFAEDISKATVVALYLSPILNAKLIPQLQALKPGSRIVSHDFDMPPAKPDKTLFLEDKQDIHGDHTLYLWNTPLKIESVEPQAIDPADRKRR
jgi:SAM-dependent methyltransferase